MVGSAQPSCKKKSASTEAYCPSVRRQQGSMVVGAPRCTPWQGQRQPTESRGRHRGKRGILPRLHRRENDHHTASDRPPLLRHVFRLFLPDDPTLPRHSGQCGTRQHVQGRCKGSDGRVTAQAAPRVKGSRRTGSPCRRPPLPYKPTCWPSVDHRQRHTQQDVGPCPAVAAASDPLSLPLLWRTALSAVLLRRPGRACVAARGREHPPVCACAKKFFFAPSSFSPSGAHHPAYGHRQRQRAGYT